MSNTIPPETARAAAAWFARRDAGALSPEEEASFAAWLAESDAHPAAMARLEAMWSTLREAPDEAGEQARARLAARKRKARRRTALSAGAAGALIGLVLLDAPMRVMADEITATGERREIALADGTSIVLNTHSALAIDYSAGARDIRLLRGEALFEVAPDPERPFVVTAGDLRARALGTAFIVRRQGSGARVTVTEHAVSVSARGREAVVDEGRAIGFAGGLGEVEAADVFAASAWRRGVLVAEDRTLREVVAELARYHSGVLQVTGEAAELRVSGVFPVDDPAAAVDLIEHTFGLGSVRAGERIIILHD